MARLDENGEIEQVLRGFERMANLLDSELDEVGKEGGDIIVKKIRAKGESMGVRRTGQTLESLGIKSSKRSGDGIVVTIAFKGNRRKEKGERKARKNSEVAFINNYGKRGQPARPFVTQGVAEAEQEAVEAAQKKIDEIIKKAGF